MAKNKSKKKAGKQKKSVTGELTTTSTDYEVVPDQTIFFKEIVNRDEIHVENLKLYWLHGLWDKLIDIDLELIEHHPERAMYALIIGSAHFQKGSLAKAKIAIKSAKLWGCSEYVICKLLASGVDNTLGNIMCIKGDLEKANEHYRSSVELASPGISKDIALRSRAVTQLESVSLRSQAIINDESVSPGKSPGDKIKADLKVIVVAGMRHSGSTVLFNIIRLAFEALELPLFSCFSEYDHCIERMIGHHGYGLIKTHEIIDDVLPIADIVITTRRDLRDTVASAKRRKFYLLDEIGSSGYAEYNRKLHDLWEKHSNHVFHYENFMTEPLETLDKLFRVIGIRGLDYAAIYEAATNIPVDDYEKTLLTPSHITDPHRVKYFTNTLTHEEISTIESTNESWLCRYGYMPVDSPQIYL